MVVDGPNLADIPYGWWAEKRGDAWVLATSYVPPDVYNDPRWATGVAQVVRDYEYEIAQRRYMPNRDYERELLWIAKQRAKL